MQENNLGSDAPLMNLDRNCAQLKNAQALESALGVGTDQLCSGIRESKRPSGKRKGSTRKLADVKSQEPFLRNSKELSHHPFQIELCPVETRTGTKGKGNL
ncbi:hypothetical protein OIU78_021848 [Salix suchowensis]|nr:hypothetical protein OIU78_021848 [Salix suchowensis]